MTPASSPASATAPTASPIAVGRTLENPEVARGREDGARGRRQRASRSSNLLATPRDRGPCAKSDTPTTSKSSCGSGSPAPSSSKRRSTTRRTPCIERRLPARGRQAPHVVRAHHRATSCAAARGRFQASEVSHVETPVPRQASGCRASSALVALRRPQRPQVDARVARLEAPQEAPDRRMERDALELVEVEEPVAADRLVARDDGRERAVELAAKTMWTTCFDQRLRSGEIESMIATGPSTGISSPCFRSARSPPSSSRCSASVRLSPLRTPPPGSSQCSTPRFSCRHSRIRPCQRRIAETRTRGSGLTRPHRSPEEPKPPSPRSVSVNSSDLDDVDGARPARRAAGRSACRARR